MKLKPIKRTARLSPWCAETFFTQIEMKVVPEVRVVHLA